MYPNVQINITITFTATRDPISPPRSPVQGTNMLMERRVIYLYSYIHMYTCMYDSYPIREKNTQFCPPDAGSRARTPPPPPKTLGGKRKKYQALGEMHCETERKRERKKKAIEASPDRRYRRGENEEHSRPPKRKRKLKRVRESGITGYICMPRRRRCAPAQSRTCQSRPRAAAGWDGARGSASPGARTGGLHSAAPRSRVRVGRRCRGWCA